jgi:hypothetical protein
MEGVAEAHGEERCLEEGGGLGRTPENTTCSPPSSGGNHAAGSFTKNPLVRAWRRLVRSREQVSGGLFIGLRALHWL